VLSGAVAIHIDKAKVPAAELSMRKTGQPGKLPIFRASIAMLLGVDAA